MSEPCRDLYEASAKLAGLAYLLECQGYAESQPDCPIKAQWGISLLCKELSEQIHQIAERLDTKEIRNILSLHSFNED